MSLDRFTWENRTHRTTGVAALIALSGEATGYIADGTGVAREMIYHWDRELRKRYFVSTHISITGRSLTGGF